MKKKFKINVFDIILILACAVFVYGAYLFSMPEQVAGSSGTTVRFTVELNDHSRERLIGKPAGFYTQIVPGPYVTESSRGMTIGRVVDAYALPFMQDVPFEAENIFRRMPLEEREFTYVVIEALAEVTERLITVNGIPIMVNQNMYVRSRDFAGRGFITALEVLD